MPQRKPLAEGPGMRGRSDVINSAERFIKIRRKQRILTLKELVAQIAPENRYEEISSGPAQGKESVESQFPMFRRDSRFFS